MNNFKTLIIFSVCILLIPSVVFIKEHFSPGTYGAVQETKDITEVTILDEETKDVSVMDLKDYLIWSVFAQMPATFEKEALKAQTVLSHTYILNRAAIEKENPTKELLGAIISTDTDTYSKIFTTQEAKDYYKDDYKTALESITEAVEEAMDYICTYKNEPIVVAYHTVSCGVTESSEDIWGEALPYLVSAESKSDEKSELFKSSKSFSQDEFKEIIKSSFGIELSGDSRQWLSIESETDNGTPLILDISGQKINAGDFASALDLQSRHFSYEIKDGNISFTAKGVGHLVGMSQYGANTMAQNQKSFEEILKYYFKGVEITKVK